MRITYERWVSRRLNEAVLCSVEESLTCIPLRNDPICRACYHSERIAADMAESAMEGRACGRPLRKPSQRRMSAGRGSR